MNTDPLLAAEVGLVRAELETLLARRDSLRRDVEAVRQEREAGEEYLRLLAERTQQAKADLKTVEAEAASAGAAADAAADGADKNGSGPAEDNVVDADFEEVDDAKK